MPDKEQVLRVILSDGRRLEYVGPVQLTDADGPNIVDYEIFERDVGQVPPTASNDRSVKDTPPGVGAVGGAGKAGDAT